MIANEERGRDMIEVAGDGGGVENGVAGVGGQPQCGDGEEAKGNLRQVPVERGDMNDGFTTEVALGKQGGGEGGFGQTIKRARFGGFVNQGVAQIGAQEEQVAVERTGFGGEPVEVAGGRGGVQGGIAGVAPQEEMFAGEEAGRELFQMAAVRQMVKRGVAGVVAQGEQGRCEHSGVEIAQASVAGGRMQDGVAGGIAGGKDARREGAGRFGG